MSQSRFRSSAGRLALATSLAFACIPAAAALASDLLPFGAFDPKGVLGQYPRSAHQHLYVNWLQLDLKSLDAAVAAANTAKRELIVTLEPWTNTKQDATGGEKMLADTIAGKFDGAIADVCGALTKAAGPVSLRWGHEMEDNRGSNPWANQEPEAFIAAYRHVIDTCRKSAPKILSMWSPKGESTLKSYYPGDNYVDVIGLSLFAVEGYDKAYYGKPRTFEEALKEKYDRVAGYGKPVSLAEAGVSGTPLYRDCWLIGMFGAAARFPLIKEVSYFNSPERFEWPKPFGLPDWTVTVGNVQFAFDAAMGLNDGAAKCVGGVTVSVSG